MYGTSLMLICFCLLIGTSSCSDTSSANKTDSKDTVWVDSIPDNDKEDSIIYKDEENIINKKDDNTENVFVPQE